jgi:hypothetical protein
VEVASSSSFQRLSIDLFTSVKSFKVQTLGRCTKLNSNIVTINKITNRLSTKANAQVALDLTKG